MVQVLLTVMLRKSENAVRFDRVSKKALNKSSLALFYLHLEPGVCRGANRNGAIDHSPDAGR